MKMKSRVAALGLGMLLAGNAYGYDIGNGIEARSDFLAGFFLLGADYRIKEHEKGLFGLNGRYWTVVTTNPLTFDRKDDGKSVTVKAVSNCELELTYRSKNETTGKTIVVDFKQASHIELLDTKIGMWAFTAKAGGAFWCEKMERNGMSWSNCGGQPKDSTGNTQIFLNGGADDRDISRAFTFFFNNVCYR